VIPLPALLARLGIQQAPSKVVKLALQDALSVHYLMDAMDLLALSVSPAWLTNNN
jgi:hypothetical protein